MIGSPWSVVRKRSRTKTCSPPEPTSCSAVSLRNNPALVDRRTPEATAASLAIEHGRLPRRLWEPAAGDGAIVQPLRAAHFDVVASDLVDYGGANIMVGVDYFTAPLPAGVTAIVKNPPYKLAVRFAARLSMRIPICRCCIAMAGRARPRPSDTCYGWFIWDASDARKCTFSGGWFDWRALPAV
jgi:hypothetical protein